MQRTVCVGFSKEEGGAETSSATFAKVDAGNPGAKGPFNKNLPQGSAYYSGKLGITCTWERKAMSPDRVPTVSSSLG